MQNLGDGWTVRTMENGAFLTKEKRDEIMLNVRPAEKAEPQFGPQEQAALEAWKEQFAGRRDFSSLSVSTARMTARGQPTNQTGILLTGTGSTRQSAARFLFIGVYKCSAFAYASNNPTGNIRDNARCR